MQKYTKLALIIICAIVLTFSLVSCYTLNPDPSNPDNNEPNDDINKECDHEQTEWIIDKNATCKDTGTKHLECSSCKKSLETATIEKTAHTEKIIPAVAATCTESGLTAGKKCSVCDTVLIKQEIISPIDHTVVTVSGKKASCTEAGLTDGKKCSVCDTVLLKQQEIAIQDHSESEWLIDKNAEVGIDGSKHKECLVCGKLLETEAIPAIREEHVHVGSEWVTVTPATCTSTGVKHFICECGHQMDTGVIEIVPHTEEIIPSVNSSCQSTGLTEGKKCSVCGEILVSQSVTAKANHTEEVVLGIAATCTESGLTDGKKCSVCTISLVSQQIIPPTGHTFSDGTCLGCGIAEPYGIWIVDGLGNPVTDVIVKIMQNGETVKMYPYKGEFLSMPLESGSYEIVLDLSQLSESYTFDESFCVLNPQKRTTAIRLFKSPETPTSVFVGYPISADYDAYYLSEGATLVDLTPNDYTFFIFRPEVSAIYTITYECDLNLTVSYHGGTFFVQGSDLSESSNDVARYENGISINVYSSNLGSEYVIGVKSASATSCVINIKNAGDPGTRIEDAPWTSYLEDEEKVKEQLNMKPDGTYTEIDLTDLTVKAVYNENDGYYHLGTADGPIIFIDLTSNSKFISSIQTICGNQRMGAYIYDVYGKLLEKRSYNELFIQYGMPDNADTPVDTPIRVPLTAKLAEAIQNFGDRNGWWKPDSETNLFTKVLLGAPYNQEYAWLLFCGYYVV